MPAPRLLRLLAATAVLSAAAGSALVATGTAAAAETTDVRDASCATSSVSDLCAAPDSLIDVRIGDVHPTQPSLGYDEVYYKLGRYSTALSKDTINKKFDDWCEANGQEEAASVQPDATITDPSTFTCTVPVGSETADTIAPMKTVVIGPGGTLYLTDGHHTLTSFAEDSGLDVHVRLRVLGNLSGLSQSAFWQTMQDNKWVWLRDVDGNAITPAQLPQNVGLANFEDDEARSIMYFARDIGYTADGAVPFQEFYWGSWLRAQQSEGIDLAGWDQDDWAGSLALVKQITQAQVALPKDTVIDAASGYTAADLSTLDAWNDGKAETKGEWAKLAVPYSEAKPGKLAYMTEYRKTLPASTAPAAPSAPTVAVTGTTVTVTWAAPADGGSAITGYTVTLSDGTSVHAAADATSATFTGVAPGSYTATVAAANAVGTSAASAASAPVTVETATVDPTTPTDPTSPAPADPSTPAPVDPSTVHGTVAVSGSLVAGGRITVRGTGFAPDTTGVRVELHSDPVLLGTVSTDATGAFTLAATLPTSLAAGTHAVVVLVDGVEVGSATVRIATTAEATADELAFTGAEGLGAAGILALAAIAVGAGVFVARRRRSSAAETVGSH